MPDFGRLEKVDVRTAWPHEAHDFTPWLAENLAALGSVLGLDLELEQVEAGVGAFSVDLLARDLSTDGMVVIENQFGQTDHDHLGKLLTYAGGYDASALVWVGESIRDEHRQALDWLNQRTDTDTHFFAVVVELLRIDDSRPAYSLKPVVLPNEWGKRQRRSGRAASSSRSERYRDYFQQLIDELREEHRFTNAKVGQPQNWYAFSSGRSGVHYAVVFAQGGRTRCELYIGTPDGEYNAQLFSRLLEQREIVERELGAGLEWETMEDRIASRIALYRDGAIDAPEHELEELRAWHVHWLLRFKAVIGPLLDSFSL